MTITITGKDVLGVEYKDLKLETSRIVYGRTQDMEPRPADLMLEIYPVGEGEPVFFYIEQVEIFQVMS